ncbi:MAG: hypothetical protein AMXMBFR13_33480 [Phycisphaerae bacterium]
MLPEINRLVEETVTLTGAAPPEVFEAAAPTLSESELTHGGGDRLYLVGLIGGKNVGKSALVNALVGHEITLRTAHGRGTEKAIAYVHEDQAPALRALLDREVPGRYELVTHRLAALSRQALLDLPDFDSHFEEHLDVTRRMLRHMLYPVWLQSIEKYADRQARDLLLKVTAGNPPQNLLFCLNKVDQLVAREGEAAAVELGEDYSRRIAEALKLPSPPRVWMISALHPDRWDLPALREQLGRQKSTEVVVQSRQMAVRRRGESLLEWFDGLRLPEQSQRLERLQRQAEEELTQRVGTPLIEGAIPRMMEDRALRWALADEVMGRRVGRWPIVNIFHVLLDPLFSGLRGRLPYGQHWRFEGARELVARHLGGPGLSVSSAVQTAFAQLQQASPQMSVLYRERRMWEPMPAELAAGELQHNLSSAVEHQRETVLTRLSGGMGPIGWLVRVVLTVGALIWFPIAQPILEAYLAEGTVTNLTLLVVQVFGVTYLLKNVGFLAVWYVLIWLALRWRTRQQVERWLDRWKAADPLNPELSLTGQVLEWMGGLLDPIRHTRERFEALIRQAERLRADVT